MVRERDWIWFEETRAVARRQARGSGQASDAADDLAQDLAVAALERGTGATRVGAWLERVGRNARIDRWRVDRRRRELAGEIEAPPAPLDPEARAIARQRRGLLRGALAALPRPLRRAALARFHADLPFDAVAARLGTREVTARTRVHRALARLRAGLGGLRGVLVPLPGAQATVLGLALVAGVARPALFPAAASVASPPSVPRARLVAQHRTVAPAAVEAPRAVAIPAARATAGRPIAAPQAPPAVQRLSFDEDVVEGALQRPDGEGVVGDVALRHVSLIELRETFVPEIVKTLEDL